MMVTGTDANGVQIGEFGSSEGILEENIMGEDQLSRKVKYSSKLKQ